MERNFLTRSTPGATRAPTTVTSRPCLPTAGVSYHCYLQTLPPYRWRSLPLPPSSTCRLLLSRSLCQLAKHSVPSLSRALAQSPSQHTAKIARQIGIAMVSVTVGHRLNEFIDSLSAGLPMLPVALDLSQNRGGSHRKSPVRGKIVEVGLDADALHISGPLGDRAHHLLFGDQQGRLDLQEQVEIVCLYRPFFPDLPGHVPDQIHDAIRHSRYSPCHFVQSMGPLYRIW